MKTTTLQAAVGSAVFFLATQPCHADAQHQHHHQHRQIHHQHHHHHAAKRDDFRTKFDFSNATSNPRYSLRLPEKLQARGGAKCEFPKNKGLFAVTPNAMNGGWALAPDQECVDGTWCPIACPAGQVMAQWKPDTHYTFPDSTLGGIYCNGGEIEVPFEDKPWCVDGTGTVDAVNKAGSVVSFCQTVLPGYEDMIIPTDVFDRATLAVPDPSYWDSTASHFYINAPGVGADKGCHWGDESQPIGNWAPFVAGANTDGSGNTFVKLGLNPVWQDSPLFNTKPTFGMKIECDGDCNGLPCEMDGNGVVSDLKATGAGGSDFCVVTVPKGGKANIIVYNLDGGSGGNEEDGGDDNESDDSEESDDNDDADESTSTPEPTPTPTPTPEPTTTPEETTTTPETTSTQTTTEEPSTTSTPTPTSTSSSEEATTSSSTTITRSRNRITSTSSAESSSSTDYFFGAVYHQNGTSTEDGSSTDPTATKAKGAHITNESDSESQAGSDAGSGSGGGGGSGTSSESENGGESSPSKSSHSENAGRRQGSGAVAGLIVAFVAAIYIL